MQAPAWGGPLMANLAHERVLAGYPYHTCPAGTATVGRQSHMAEGRERDKTRPDDEAAMLYEPLEADRFSPCLSPLWDEIPLLVSHPWKDFPPYLAS